MSIKEQSDQGLSKRVRSVSIKEQSDQCLSRSSQIRVFQAVRSGSSKESQISVYQGAVRSGSILFASACPYECLELEEIY